jgi:hypothetical protein
MVSRAKHLWLAAALVTAAACTTTSSSSTYTPPFDALSFCPTGAVGVGFDLLIGDAKNTDQIAVQVNVEGDPTQLYTFSRRPGGSEESLEVDLTHYDADRYKHITVVAVARLYGKGVSSASKTTQIDNDCTNVHLLFGVGGDHCFADSDCKNATCGSNNCCGGSYCY